MSTRGKPLLLNRALFVLRPFQATALTTLTTLIHRFPAAGTFEVFIRRDGSLLHRAPVHVADGGVFQINIDMAAGSFDATYAIAPGGALGFYVGKGEGAYSVSLDRITGRERVTILDSTKGIPAGDLFAVTLVRAGRYRVIDPVNKIDGVVTVETPAVPERTRLGGRVASAPRQRYRPDQPTGVTIARGTMQPKEVKIFAGQTVVFDCTVPANLRIEPLDQPTLRARETAPPGKLRRTFPKTNRGDKG